MRIINVNTITQNIKDMCIKANHFLAEDMDQAMKHALDTEQSPLGRQILDQLQDNLKIAAEDMIPICQDTGMAVVFLKVGQDVHFEGGSLEDAVNEGSMIGPASMIVTGMLIAEMNLRNIFENVKVYFISFLRLVVIPVISLAILKISGLVNIHPDGKKLLLIVFLAVITPSASTITQMCQVYGNDSKYASAINVMTTLLSIITMPLMVLLYQTMM